jgi:formamidopyrimidine-DNA glycosylase
MTKKELKERLDQLGPEPANPDQDLVSWMTHLAQKVDILTEYLLEHKTLGGGR